MEINDQIKIKKDLRTVWIRKRLDKGQHGLNEAGIKGQYSLNKAWINDNIDQIKRGV